MTVLMETRVLASEDIGVARELAEREGPGALFLLERLANIEGSRSCFGAWEGTELVGLALLVDCLPPFGKTVVLPAGRVAAVLSTMASTLALEPEMMLGPEIPTRIANENWPARWPTFKARRDEILFIQQSGIEVSLRPDLVVRQARLSDVGTLIGFRIAMERESGVALVSTDQQAEDTVRRLIAARDLWLVTQDREIAGCCAITARNATYEQLGFVYVARDRRLTGVSDHLLGSVCAQIHARGRCPLMFTAASSEALINRASVLGFEPVGSHHKYYYERHPEAVVLASEEEQP